LKPLHPFEAIIAKDGRQALNETLERHPNVCVLDIGMPVIGGIQYSAILAPSIGPIVASEGPPHTSESLARLEAIAVVQREIESWGCT
jgi:CheY-like chemotaxis protein